MTNLTPKEQTVLAGLLKTESAVERPKYAWDENFQRRLVAMLLTDTYFLVQAKGLVEPSYFSNESHVIVTKLLFKYFEKYKALPERFILTEELREATKDRDDAVRLLFQSEFESLYDYYVPGLSTRDALMDKLTTFAKAQALKVAFHESLDDIGKAPDEDATWSKVYERLRQAMLIDRSFEVGLEIFLTPEEMFRRMREQFSKGEKFTSGFQSIDNALMGSTLKRGEIYAWIALPGRGKCFSKFINILMYDGTLKYVQDVVVGDLVMGPDSKPRTVLSTHTLIDRKYEIRPVKGDSYFVNGEHILSLKNSQGVEDHPARVGDTNIYNISVNDWFRQSKHFKEATKGWRTGVDFPAQEVRIDPYSLGVWLVDGQVVHPVLRSYGLIRNKHIPQEYKANSREVRLQLLAGLLDSDGHLKEDGCVYEITQKRKNLAEDILFLARSLGFDAYMSQCEKYCQTGGGGTYWRIIISGNTDEIPVRIPRKKANPRKQVKDVLLTGIDVIDTGELDEFYGFEVDGDHLFLLGDFTVVHNSLSMVKAAVENVKLGHKVLYITMEMDEVGIAQRFYSQFTRNSINFLLDKEQEICDSVHDYVKDKNKEEQNRCIVRQFPGGTVTVDTIRAYFNFLLLYGFKPDMVIIDYVGEMKNIPGVQTWESMYLTLRDIRGFAVEQQFCCMTCVQPNKSAADLTEHEYIDEHNIGSSFDQFKPLDGFWSINQLDFEKDECMGRGYIIKHRNGKGRFPFYLQFDYDILNIYEIVEQKYRIKMNERTNKKADEVNIDGVDVKKKKKRWNPIEPEDGE